MSSLCLSCVRRLSLLRITPYNAGSLLCKTNLITFRNLRTQNGNALFSTTSVYTCNVHDGIKETKKPEREELEEKGAAASYQRLEQSQPDQRLSHGRVQLQQLQQPQQQELSDYEDYVHSDRVRICLYWAFMFTIAITRMCTEH